MSQKLACVLLYPMCIQTYDQVSILRIWSKMRLHRTVLLGSGFKMPKISLKIVKVGMHSYLPNVHLNLWLNFNSKKLVKSETSLCSFTKVGLKGPKIAWSVTEVGVHASLSSAHPNLWSNFNTKRLVRSETPSCIFARVGLKGVQIAGNYKIWCALLSSKCTSKSMIKF